MLEMEALLIILSFPLLFPFLKPGCYYKAINYINYKHKPPQRILKQMSDVIASLILSFLIISWSYSAPMNFGGFLGGNTTTN